MPVTWEGEDAIVGVSIDIGDFDTTSFHVDTAGNLWLGAATFALAPFRVSSVGELDIGGMDATSLHVDSAGNLWLGSSAYSTAPLRFPSAGNIEGAGVVSGGPLNGLYHFFADASSGEVTIREGSLVLVSSSGVSSIKFLHAAAGPIYTTVANLLANTSGEITLKNAAGTADVRLDSSGSTKLRANIGSTPRNLSLFPSGIFIDSGVGESGIVVGRLSQASGRCWAKEGSFSGTTNGSGLLTVNLGSTFPAAPQVFLQATSGAGVTPLQINATTTTTFTIQGANSTAITGFWLAWLAL